MTQRPAADLIDTAAALGRRLRDERVARGWSGVELADRSGLDQSAISKFERGKRFPTEPARRRLEAAFGWPAGRLVRMAGLVEEARTPDDYLAGRPDLTESDRAVIVALIEHLERRNRPRPSR
jgi:transcriptional regulator with XRE-family HTH domain